MSPEEKEKRSSNMARLAREHPAFAERHARMIGDTNPMKDPAVRQKVSDSLIGVSRPHLCGGNGTGLTAPQQALLDALPDDWHAEFMVWAGKKKYPTWPIMLVDLAVPHKKWAVEVDGLSHNALQVRSRDARKDELLEAAGWRVFRIKNQQVMDDPEAAAQVVLGFFDPKTPG
jgi:hypothetical protein